MGAHQHAGVPVQPLRLRNPQRQRRGSGTKRASVMPNVRPCRPAVRGLCADSATAPMSLGAVVRDYRAKHRADARAELRYFANFATITEAITAAASSENEHGKRLPHQRRIKRKAIRSASAALLRVSADISNCDNFHALFEVIQEAVSDIPGIGELYIYDVAHRIGAWLGREPRKVYLHCGVRAGARALGLNAASSFLEMSSLPEELRTLSAGEVEDILCIYKGRFRRPKAHLRANSRDD